MDTIAGATVPFPPMGVLFLLVLSSLTLTSAPLPAQEPLEVVMVQYRVNPADYTSLAAFEARLDGILAEATARYDPDLVVFPEYVSVFALFPDVITASGAVRRGVVPEPVSAALRRSAGATAKGEVPPRTPAMHAFVRERARRYNGAIRGVWTELAARYDLWLLAGSAFVPVGEGVRNRLWVIDPDGAVRYHQDKVYLTPYERRVLGLDPGTVAAAEEVTVEGVELGVTICRDSYFDAWESRFAGVDLWIDVRANGELWNQGVRRRFDAALPERVAETPVELGASTSLNGTFLTLFWQGPAFVVDADGHRIRQSGVVDGDALLPLSVDPDS